MGVLPLPSSVSLKCSDNWNLIMRTGKSNQKYKVLKSMSVGKFTGVYGVHPIYRLELPYLIHDLRIGLLGGSFDPPHEGHLHISKWAMKQLQLNQVWWLITDRNPLKDRTPAPVKHRLQSAKQFVKDPRIRISCLENCIQSKHTVTTLSYLRRKFSTVKFVWLMGADNLNQFTNWYYWEQIIYQMPIAVFPRPGYSVSAASSKANKIFCNNWIKSDFVERLVNMDAPAWALLSTPLCKISSTSIRRKGAWSN